MRKTLLAAVAFAAFASPAFAERGPYAWFSAPIYIGQGQDPHNSNNKQVPLFVAMLFSSKAPDGEQYIFLHYGAPQTQESYADHEALQLRAQCNATGDDSCVQGQPGWVELYGMLEVTK
jgi:hypothetical protein